MWVVLGGLSLIMWPPFVSQWVEIARLLVCRFVALILNPYLPLSPFPFLLVGGHCQVPALFVSLCLLCLLWFVSLCFLLSSDVGGHGRIPVSSAIVEFLNSSFPCLFFVSLHAGGLCRSWAPRLPLSRFASYGWPMPGSSSASA